MPVIERMVISNLSSDVVFAYVAEFEHIVEWDPGVVACRPLTDGPVRIGSSYSLDLRYGRTSLEMTYEVTELDPSRLIVLRGTGGRIAAEDRISFVATDGGGTRVDYRADLQMRGLYRLVQPFLGAMFERVGDGAQHGLERRLGEIERSRS
jgi:Polyketide cyclase / dehydrase and lipid transport